MSSPRLRYLPNDDGSAILVVLYDGAYGKTLRIDTQRVEALEVLAALFARLSGNGSSRLSLAGQEGFVLGAPLTDVIVEGAAEVAVSVDGTSVSPTVTWAQPTSEWHRSLGLLEGLMARARQGGSGHQYLTPEGSEVLVELAYAE